MNRVFKLDNKMFRLYEYENNSWKTVIELQVKEIPEMEKFLEELAEPVTNDGQTNKIEKQLFYSQMQKQLNEMVLLNAAIAEQQSRINTSQAFDMNADIDAFCYQDILRDRIKGVENRYIELRCNFMSYLSNLA